MTIGLLKFHKNVSFELKRGFKIVMFRDRFFKEPQQSFFLFGPRGTGKSTLIRERFPDVFLIDLLNPNVRRTYSAHPEKLLVV